MDSIVGFFQHNPLIAVFLTLGYGFWLGKVRFRSFSLGAVAATLIVGVVIGQMHIIIPGVLKTAFFLLFLFATGYSVGPQFFKSFKGNGGKQALYAVVVAIVCSGLVIVAAKIMGYDSGVAAGLFAGSQTVSASLGLLGDTVNELPMTADRKEYLQAIIPACYAVTYVFGTIGTSWFLSAVGPKLMGGIDKVLDEVGRIEQEMDHDSDSVEPGFIKAQRPVAFRCYEVSTDLFHEPISVSDLESKFHQRGEWLFVERLRTGGRIIDPDGSQLIHPGDIVVIGARTENILDVVSEIGPEVTDPELLNFGAERTPVTVSSRGINGQTLGRLRKESYMERVMVASIKRNGVSIPMKQQTQLDAGDVVMLVGWPRDVAEAASRIGYADRQTERTDMVFLGVGIGLGCIIGALTISFKGLPMGLGMSVGVLLMGLVLGWYRNRRPVFGRIPSAALWLLSNLGINMFIAVIGISAGAFFLRGIHEAGALIFVVGAVCTIAGILICLFIARKIFRFSAPEAMGCLAGARCCVAAQGAVVDVLHSDLPNLGYTVTYAVANIVLVFSSLAVLLLV